MNLGISVGLAKAKKFLKIAIETTHVMFEAVISLAVHFFEEHLINAIAMLSLLSRLHMKNINAQMLHRVYLTSHKMKNVACL